MKRKLVFLCLCLLAVQAFAVDVRKIKAWTEGLRDETIKIGVFMRPLSASMVSHTLKSGMEWSRGTLPMGIWGKLWLVESLRGDFDNLFTYREHWFLMEERYLVSDTFSPFSGTTWLLLLKPQLDEQGHLLPNAFYEQDELDQMPWATDENLFSIYRRDFGALCIGWENTRDTSDTFIYSTNLVTRMKEIMAEPDFPQGYDELYDLVEQALSDNLVTSGLDLGDSWETQYFPE